MSTPSTTTTTTATTATVMSLLVACVSLGVVYACAVGVPGGDGTQGRVRAGEDTNQDGDGDGKVRTGASVGVGVGVGAGKGRGKGKGRKKKNEAEDKDVDKDKSHGKGKGKGKGKVEPAVIIPGDFDVHPVARTRADVDVGPSPTHALASGSGSQHLPNASKKKHRHNDKASKKLGEGGGQNSESIASRAATAKAIRPSSAHDTDSSWTHVGAHISSRMTVDATSSDLELGSTTSPEEPRVRGVARAHDSITTGVRGPRGDLASAQPTLAVAPSGPNETRVDAMLERPDVPRRPHVIRVQPRADDTPVPGFTWEDYGDVVVDRDHDDSPVDDADQGEWDVVQSRRRQRPTQTTTESNTPTPTANASPPPPGNMSKKQRQNARKREMAKSLKAETEAARLEGLARHKRELERLWMSEDGKRKGASGGMRAVVDDLGKLVWE